MHGEGRMAFANGDVLTGSWVDGGLTGKGTFEEHTGDKYTGQVRHAKPINAVFIQVA